MHQQNNLSLVFYAAASVVMCFLFVIHVDYYTTVRMMMMGLVMPGGRQFLSVPFR